MSKIYCKLGGEKCERSGIDRVSEEEVAIFNRAAKGDLTNVIFEQDLKELRINHVNI